MKILIYTTAFAPSVGGVETYVMLLAKGLAAAHVREERLRITVATKTAANSYDDSALPFAVVRQPSALKLMKLLRQADVVQLAGPCLGPLALAWLMRKRIVIEHHGYQAACPNGLFLREPMKEICPGHFERGEYAQCLRCASSEYGAARGAWKVLSTFPRRWLSRRVKQNVCVSAHVEHRLNLPRSSVIYHGIPPVTNGDARPDGHPAGGHLVFGYVGRLVAEKNLTTLVESARQLKDEGFDFRLRFVGDGPEKAGLQAAVGAAGLDGQTLFTGYLTGKSLSAAVDEISVVVMPSVWEETFGLSALEHMQRGRVVIAADVGGLAEVVGDSGLKFPPGNVTSLATHMRSVMERPELLREYANRARERSELFTLDKMIAGHVSLYRDLASV